MTDITGTRRKNGRKKRIVMGLAVALLLIVAPVIAAVLPKVFNRADSGQWSAYAAMGSLLSALISLWVADRSAESGERSAEAAESALEVADRARQESGPVPVVRVRVETLPVARRSKQAVEKGLIDSYLEPVLRSRLSISVENHGNTSFHFSDPHLRFTAGDLDLGKHLLSGRVAERSAEGAQVTLEELLGEATAELRALDGMKIDDATVSVDVPGFGSVQSDPFVFWGDRIDTSNETLNAFHKEWFSSPSEAYHQFLIPEEDGLTWRYTTWRPDFQWSLPFTTSGAIDYDAHLSGWESPVHRVIWSDTEIS